MSFTYTTRNTLHALKSINASIARTAITVSTGKPVNTAADSAAYWSIATAARSHSDAGEALLDALRTGEAQLATADAALSAIHTRLRDIDRLLVRAPLLAADRGAIQREIGQLLSDIRHSASRAVSGGINFLSVDSGAAGYDPVVSFALALPAGDGRLSLATIDIDRTETAVIDPGGGRPAGILDEDRTEGDTTTSVMDIEIAALTDSAADLTTLSEIAGILDGAIEDVVAAQATIGAALGRVETQIAFLTSLNSAETAPICALVDRDAEEDAARLIAHQARHQLTIETLAIANARASRVLPLFR